MSRQIFDTVDLHTAGEPVRIVTGGYPELAGRTILDKRRDARDRFDRIRTALMLEPRGHAGMYGVIPMAPCHPDADLSVLFTHNEGYSTMCGHATIAIGRWAVDSGRVAADNGSARFRLETPCGIVRVSVEPAEGDAPLVTFESVRAFASHLDLAVEVPGHGRVTLDIAFGGAYYAILPSSRLGLPLATTPVDTLVAAGVAITDAVRAAVEITHPDEPDLGFLYGTILTDDAAMDAQSDNLCIFAEGQIDRSPTGSGVTARMALDYAKGSIGPGRARAFRGISGQAFRGELGEADGSGLDASVTVRVSGRAHYAGEARFIVEAADPLGFGFTLPRRFADLGQSR
ncbi:MAG TPA: proline racemase family protein [Aliidongia sp.]|uniref:proline racemase family protein n=1 Tax=Aliidongia sp. TaxID=1914230 RepID=UPI002DDCE9B4|nr:proline racemase family protein [Aliidongia sp.]HEV2673930.1 proline racemase family protein [Aliidongia sp.]